MQPTSTAFDVHHWRQQFPALGPVTGGPPIVHLDGPAGSQVPRQVIDAIAEYLRTSNANTGGHFATSLASDACLQTAHRAAADFLGARDPECVIFGPNMTTMTVALARAMARTWSAGDEVLVTRMEHDANFTPWVHAARDAGATVRYAGIRSSDCTLDLDDLESKLSSRTRLVAVGAASNAVGTINPVRQIADLAHGRGAQLFVDAVHFAPHLPIDVEAWDCDFVACSAYKFFGPHVGILWGRRDALEQLPAERLRPVEDRPPGRWMPGTQNHEGIAGTTAAIDYLAALGRAHDATATGRRAALAAAYAVIEAYERRLTVQLLDGLESIPGLKIWGITAADRLAERVPTVAVTHARPATEIAGKLAERQICVWHGNFYALPLTEALGLEPDGLVRIGLLHYNTQEEVERLITALRELT